MVWGLCNEYIHSNVEWEKRSEWDEVERINYEKRGMVKIERERKTLF